MQKITDSFVALIDLIRTLRGPNGCPWDRKQTPADVKSYLVEELYEVLEAVDRGDKEHLQEEVGDLLFMILFLTKYARSASGVHSPGGSRLRWLPTGAFHALFALLVAVYGWAVVGIIRSVHTGGLEGSTGWIFAALFAFLHFTPLNAELLDGVAKQYILDHYLQPCVFGVLVLLAIRLLLERRNLPAALCLAVAVLFHPGAYLMAAALILAVMVWRERKQQIPYTRAVAPVLVFASLVAPLAIYQAHAFAPTSPETWRQAIDILANQNALRGSELSKAPSMVQRGRLMLLGPNCRSL